MKQKQEDHPFSYNKIPQSRIATFDVYSVGVLKHHVSALLEFDVTDSRQKLNKLRRSGTNISFNAWLIKAISRALEKFLNHTRKYYKGSIPVN